MGDPASGTVNAGIVISHTNNETTARTWPRTIQGGAEARGGGEEEEEQEEEGEGEEGKEN